MKKLILLSATALLILATTSCKKEEQSNNLSVDFKLALLDTLGNEKTVFNQGENIIFSFQVINKSSEDLYLENFLPNNDFFRVYQPHTNEGLLNCGKTYDGICYIGSFSVPANQTLEIKCPWVNSENSAHYFYCLNCEKELHERLLPFGKYYTEFSQSFKFGEIQTEEKHFKINFTIK